MPCTVQKPDGRRQPYNRQKVLARIFSLLTHENAGTVDVNQIVTDVESNLPDKLTTTELQSRMAAKTAQLALQHPDYDTLAAKIELAVLRDTTPSTFSESCAILASVGVLTSQFMDDVRVHVQYLDALANSAPEYPYTYSGIRVVERLALLDNDGVIVERPSYMFLRVAVHLYGTDISAVTRIFHQLSQHLYALDITLLANAGTQRKELTANYMLTLDAPYTSKGIYSSLAQSAAITNSFGDVAISFNNSFSRGANVNGNASQGLLPVLELFNTSLFLKLNGEVSLQSCMTIYIEPWHGEIKKLLDVIMNSDFDPEDPHHMRHVLWIPDIFMRRVRSRASWSLFSPSDTPFLVNNFGPAFDAAYAAYEADDRVAKIVINAFDLMERILECQIRTGQPSIMFKDACNKKNSQSHLGVITHGGVNADFVHYSTPSESAVVHAASIVLPSFINQKTFNFNSLQTAVDTLTIALNIAIDKSSYPTSQAKRGALKHRALGIGFEGLSDTFLELDISYDSSAARTLNYKIIETMYYAALMASTRYAETQGCYASYANSTLSNGKLQFDLWGRPPNNLHFNWTGLKERLSEHGAANSLLISLHYRGDIPSMTGYCNGFEPIASNIVTRRTSPRSYNAILPSLVARLTGINAWNERMRQQIIDSNGSIQNILEIPANIRALFKTAKEVGPMPIVELAVDRAPFVCHSQAMSIFMSNPSTTKLSTLHFLTWKNGLKTALHILHASPLRSLPGHEVHSSSESSPSPLLRGTESALSSPPNHMDLVDVTQLPPLPVATRSTNEGGTIVEHDRIVRFTTEDVILDELD